MNKKPTYISLFSNAGIGCFGFKIEGFDCVATNEKLSKRLAIQKINRKCKYESGYICDDITLRSTKLKIFEQIDFWKRVEKIKEIDAVIATPPCQGMSVANHKKKNELPRNSLVVDALNLIREINPRFVILENVRSFLNTSCLDSDGRKKTVRSAIEAHLSNYHLLMTTMNFKDYGNPSQRNRTLVVATRKDLVDVTPYDIFPARAPETTLNETIGHMKPLKEMGEIDPNDIFHSFRPYPQHMLLWVDGLKEGQSSFDNKDSKCRPHQIIDGKLVINQNKNGDKYRRCFWNKAGFCVHTRNDQLASQMTIHPRDNRVFSIRELMRLMSIPDEFKWTEQPLVDLNRMSTDAKRKFLKKQEMNIRQTIGEAVPTIIFKNIAAQIKEVLSREMLTDLQIHVMIKQSKLDSVASLHAFISSNLSRYSYTMLSRIAELANAKRLQNAAYYTSQDICYSLVTDLPEPNAKDTVRILEPSVGLGNFLPLLIKKYGHYKRVIIDAVDIDSDALAILKLLVKKMDPPKNVQINIIHADFLDWVTEIHHRYDVTVGNPPFKKLTGEAQLLARYRQGMHNSASNNLVSFFIERCQKISDCTALIAPKSLLSAPEFNLTREFINNDTLVKICDYGEHAFDIKIETIGIVIKSESAKADHSVKLESYITKSIQLKKQSYIADTSFPYWLIYRDELFDKIASKLKFNLFSSMRDRQITNRMLRASGKYRVLKSRNIASNRILDIKGYDCYIDSLQGLSISKIVNKRAILIPNLTYNPRACFLPKNSIADGSVAFAFPKNGYLIQEHNLTYFSTDEFRTFYQMARNRSSRSMNIDSNSIFFFGLPKNELVHSSVGKSNVR